MSKLDLQKRPPLGTPKAKRLNSQPRFNLDLERIRTFIIQLNDQGLPRFGVLSLLARRVPFFCYDHPAFVQQCDTAFTDGFHVFIHTEFLKELLEEDQASRRAGRFTHSVVPVLLHELCHILYRHHARLPHHAPKTLWAIACDIVINSRLKRGFPEMPLGPVFDQAWGTDKHTLTQFEEASEEEVLQTFWQPDDPDPPEPESPNNRQGTPDHLMPLQKLIQLLQQNGLDHIRKTLQLPDPNDTPALEQFHKERHLGLLNSIHEAEEIREEHACGDAMAGEHIEKTAAEEIDRYYRPKLNWALMLKEMLLGEGMQYDYSDEVPADIFFVPAEQMGLETEIYLGSPIPVKPDGDVLVIIDTSKSVDKALLQRFISELQGLLEQEQHHADTWVVTADTVIRGEWRELDAASASQLNQITLEGRGGTHLTQVLNQALQEAEEQALALRAIVYFSDLMDAPPKREQLPETLPDLVFISPRQPGNRRFEQQIKPFAQLYEIEAGNEVIIGGKRDG